MKKKPTLKTIIFYILYVALLAFGFTAVSIFSYPFLGFGELYRQEIAQSLTHFMLLRFVALSIIIVLSGTVLFILNLIYRPQKIKRLITVLLLVTVIAFVVASVQFFSDLPTMG